MFESLKPFSGKRWLGVYGSSAVTSELSRRILSAGLDDWVPLTAVEGFARQLGSVSDGEVVAFGLQAIRDLAEEGLVVLGAVSDEGFVEWPEPIDESLARVEAAWRTLDRNEWGFTCWLNNTSRGDERARSFEAGAPFPPSG